MADILERYGVLYALVYAGERTRLRYLGYIASRIARRLFEEAAVECVQQG